MSEKLSKIVQWVLYVLMGITTLIGILFYTNTVSNTNLLIYWGYILLILVIATTLVVSLRGILQKPKSAIKLLIIVVAMALIFFISFTVSENTFSQAFLEKQEVTETTVRLVGAGAIVLYLFGLGAIGAIIYSTISRIIK